MPVVPHLAGTCDVLGTIGCILGVAGEVLGAVRGVFGVVSVGGVVVVIEEQVLVVPELLEVLLDLLEVHVVAVAGGVGESFPTSGPVAGKGRKSVFIFLVGLTLQVNIFSSICFPNPIENYN